MVRKLLKDPNTQQVVGRKRRVIDNGASSVMTDIGLKTANSIMDARNAMQMLPDIEIAMNLLVSSILAPKDMNTTEITYSLRNKVVRSDIAQQMIEIVRTHFETYHKLKDQLEVMLEDCLFKTGSYPVLILAENSLDQFINSDGRISQESLQRELGLSGKGFKSLGFLGSLSAEPTAQPRSTFESFFTAGSNSRTYEPASQFIPGVEIVDNPNYLKLARLQERIRTDKVNEIMYRQGIRRTMEGLYTAGVSSGDEDIVASFYRSPNYTVDPQAYLKTTGSYRRQTVGHPLVMKLPCESVIPVHERSNPSKHLGYFILIDTATGSPVYQSYSQDFYRQMTNAFAANQSMVSSVLENAKRVYQGYSSFTSAAQMQFDAFQQLYNQLLEFELNERLRKGIYGQWASVAKPEEVYRLMLARSLQGKQTQLLYVPKEMLIYMAFEYNEDGIGTSLITKSIILAGQRANLSVASVMAELKNAVNTTILDITLDEEDDDPSGTVEHILTEHAKLRRGAYPMFISAPNDIIDWLQNAAVEVQVNGNTAYPSTKVAISETNRNRPIPNMEFQKDLRDRQLWSFGIPPELVDTARGAEFATSIVTNNLMLIKTVMRYQQAFTPFLEEYVRTYVLSDGILLEQLRDVIRKALAQDKQQKTIEPVTDQTTTKLTIGGSTGAVEDRIIVDFLYDLKIDLPKPEGAKTQNLQEAYEKQKAFVEAALEAYVSDAAISNDLSGQIGQHTDALKNALTMLFMRRWLRENGALPELDEIVQLGENNSPGLDLMAEIEAHTSPIKINLRDFIVKYLRRAADDNKVIETVENQTGEEAPESSGGSSGGEEETSGEEGAEDDFGADLDEEPSEGGEEEAAEEEEGSTEEGGEKKTAEE